MIILECKKKRTLAALAFGVVMFGLGCRSSTEASQMSVKSNIRIGKAQIERLLHGKVGRHETYLVLNEYTYTITGNLPPQPYSVVTSNLKDRGIHQKDFDRDTAFHNIVFTLYLDDEVITAQCEVEDFRKGNLEFTLCSYRDELKVSVSFKFMKDNFEIANPEKYIFKRAVLRPAIASR